MESKTSLVTGVTSGIGRATAVALAERGAEVLLVAREQAAGEAVKAEIQARVPLSRVGVFAADLSSQRDLRRLAEQIAERHAALHVLVNNAGLMRPRRELTEDGVEVMLATNHMGPFMLTNLLLGLLRRGAPSRIVTVSGEMHRQVKAIPWDDLQGERGFNGLRQYALTKLMNLMFTHRIAECLQGSGVTANCASPGFVRTRLGRSARGSFALFLKLARPFMASPEEGAATPLYLATTAHLEHTTGRYFRNQTAREPSRLAQDPARLRVPVGAERSDVRTERSGRLEVEGPGPPRGSGTPPGRWVTPSRVPLKPRTSRWRGPDAAVDQALRRDLRPAE
jgi:retinol dehydrogenase 12